MQEWIYNRWEVFLEGDNAIRFIIYHQQLRWFTAWSSHAFAQAIYIGPMWFTCTEYPIAVQCAVSSHVKVVWAEWDQNIRWNSSASIHRLSACHVLSQRTSPPWSFGTKATVRQAIPMPYLLKSTGGEHPAGGTNELHPWHRTMAAQHDLKFLQQIFAFENPWVSLSLHSGCRLQSVAELNYPWDHGRWTMKCGNVLWIDASAKHGTWINGSDESPVLSTDDSMKF